MERASLSETPDIASQKLRTDNKRLTDETPFIGFPNFCAASPFPRPVSQLYHILVANASMNYYN